jgi:hypothetical protein
VHHLVVADHRFADAPQQRRVGGFGYHDRTVPLITHIPVCARDGPGIWLAWQT